MAGYSPLVIIDPTIFFKVKNVTDNAFNFMNIQLGINQLYLKIVEMETILEADIEAMPVTEAGNYFLELFTNFNNANRPSPTKV